MNKPSEIFSDNETENYIRRLYKLNSCILCLYKRFHEKTFIHGFSNNLKQTERRVNKEAVYKTTSLYVDSRSEVVM